VFSGQEILSPGRDHPDYRARIAAQERRSALDIALQLHRLGPRQPQEMRHIGLGRILFRVAAYIRLVTGSGPKGRVT
jgi:hypothetical protein